MPTLSAPHFSITTAECREERRSREPRHQAKRFPPGPRTSSRPSRARDRPNTNRPRWRARRASRRRATTAAPSAPKRRRCGLPATPQSRTKTRSRSRRGRGKQRRMEGEARVLQDRIKIAALERCVGNTQERIRSGENEKLKGRRDPGLHGERVRFQLGPASAAESRDQRAKQSQDRDPASWSPRGFPRCWSGDTSMAWPIRVLVDVKHREVGSDVADGERAERERHESELRQRRRRRNARERRVVAARADDRHRA